MSKNPDWMGGTGERSAFIKKARVFARYLPKILTCRTHRVKGYLFRSAMVEQYLGSHEVRKLHVGAARNEFEGWLNTDYGPRSRTMIFLDATVDFPFGRAVFDYVYSEHLIEHLPYNDGKFMLRECHRVLRPGGKIRIATPDLRKLVGLLFDEAGRGPEYVRWITEKFLPHVRTRAPSIVVNNAFYNWGHRFLYDFATLKAMLEEAGFADVAMFGSGESNDDNLRGLERHGEMVGNPEMARFETMVLQARRPAD